MYNQNFELNTGEKNIIRITMSMLTIGLRSVTLTNHSYKRKENFNWNV
jgi:hypothetical protein